MVPKYLAKTISRSSPAMREIPVPIEKIAVFRATRPPPGGAGAVGSWAGSSALAVKAAIVRRSAARPGGSRCLRSTTWPTFIHRRSGSSAPSASVSRTAATPRRSRPTSARLEAQVEGGDQATAGETHRELVSTIDKAVKRGAMHKNTGARKKSRAARVLAGAGAATSD